jgi:hypothetical protein
LQELFNENPEKFNMSMYTTGSPCVIATVQARIAELACQANLEHLDKSFKEKFKEQFPTDIPHVRDLPTNVFHHIKLRPEAPVSVAHAYSCPRKYRAG